MQNGGLGTSFGVNGLQSGGQGSPANAAASLPQNVNVPPRSGPTPQSSLHATLGMQGTPQQANSRLPSGSFSMSPSMSAALPFQQQSPAQNGAPFGGAGQLHPGLHSNLFPPLERSRFENIYNNFCAKHPDINRDPRLFDGRQIDIHKLHVEVNREGGMNKVSFGRVCLKTGIDCFSRSRPTTCGPSSRRAWASQTSLPQSQNQRRQRPTSPSTSRSAIRSALVCSTRSCIRRWPKLDGGR